ncbi:hypothetical protein P7K49_004743 [Saguinus oedipus]|uniref:Uncharacterized protein n=1 Tax=Saguinus oedipus TaxID=9490 RepID=A0ABQ9W8D0_SAGOE|nr:hypothetical protein P7K49_004743 [Saguinus oedipus]
MKLDVKFKDLGIHHSQILFKTEEMPIHGFLQLDMSPEQEMEMTFTMSDLWQGKVWYVHDGSEEPMDYFTSMDDEFFVVASITGPEGTVRDLDSEQSSTEIKVTISVGLKNDEKPVHMIDKAFHIVRNGQRLLTLADLFPRR